MTFQVKQSKRKQRINENSKYINSYASAEGMGIKPNDSMIGTVYNVKTGEIEGYTQGHTFLIKDNIKFSKDIKKYEIVDDEGNSDIVYATNPENVKKSIGYGSSYKEEYGDHAYFIQKLKDKEANIYEVNVEYKKVE